MAGELDRVQARLGVPQTGEWDASTDGALIAYQQSGSGAYAMAAHGHPDPATLVNLGYYTPEDIFRREWVSYLEGAERPSTFARDLGTAIDQVPRWAWAVTAVVFAGFSYMAYRADKKRGGA